MGLMTKQSYKKVSAQGKTKKVPVIILKAQKQHMNLWRQEYLVSGRSITGRPNCRQLTVLPGGAERTGCCPPALECDLREASPGSDRRCCSARSGADGCKLHL